MFKRKRRLSPDLSLILERAPEFGAVVKSDEAYHPSMNAVEMDIDGSTPLQMSEQQQLDSLTEITKGFGFTRKETAALAVVVLTSVDEARSLNGGIVRAERVLASKGIVLDGETLAMFSLVTAKWFRPEALAEQSKGN